MESELLKQLADLKELIKDSRARLKDVERHALRLITKQEPRINRIQKLLVLFEDLLSTDYVDEELDIVLREIGNLYDHFDGLKYLAREIEKKIKKQNPSNDHG